MSISFSHSWSSNQEGAGLKGYKPRPELVRQSNSENQGEKSSWAARLLVNTWAWESNSDGLWKGLSVGKKVSVGPGREQGLEGSEEQGAGGPEKQVEPGL